MSKHQTKKPIKVAIVGSPNTGKTTLVNALAGTKLRVGNWPGVTVDVHEARIRHLSEEIDLVDLPGIYSLNTFTPEETVTRDFLLQKRPEIIVNIVDATHLERNLSLTFQLMEFGLPMVLVLNMMDEARQKGIRFNLPELQRILGYPIIQTVSTKKEGLDLLKDCL
ncbi:MAG: FeoB small GTPase domain-containing protein, partial [Candidatus Margulisiibacteriota bacterium]